MVEEVESEGGDDAFWAPHIDRILSAVEMSDDGTGALRTEIAGLENLRLESWELKVGRRAVSVGVSALSERERTLLRAAALRLKAEEETETLRATAPMPPPAELLRA